MGNLEVVSLSVNRISTLKEFGYCPKLQVIKGKMLGTLFKKK
jgi:hypothetical protein